MPTPVVAVVMAVVAVAGLTFLTVRATRRKVAAAAPVLVTADVD